MALKVSTKRDIDLIYAQSEPSESIFVTFLKRYRCIGLAFCEQHRSLACPGKKEGPCFTAESFICLFGICLGKCLFLITLLQEPLWFLRLLSLRLQPMPLRQPLRPSSQLLSERLLQMSSSLLPDELQPPSSWRQPPWQRDLPNPFACLPSMRRT